MITSPSTQTTDFTRDVLGRYVCNGLDEALRSTSEAIRADAKPFDIVVLGGGTFGAALAAKLFANDRAHAHRILVLEGGPFVLPEHVQNLPVLHFNPPGALQRIPGQSSPVRNEVWGLAWHSDIGFPGLAYCLGGRSLFWGGWSPRYLAAEMPAIRWPQQVLDELNGQYFDAAAEQIGVDITNDFIHGPLHVALRQQLLEGIEAGEVTGVVPPDELPLHLADIPSQASAAERNVLKLEAPLAVQTSIKQAGLFPGNKFSIMPLLVKAARAAYSESAGDDFEKRLMVVPNCHVIRLVRDAARVSRIITNLGDIDVPQGGQVIIALGTIESVRLALLSFEGLPNSARIGQGVMAHLRSNLDIRIPRTALRHLDEAIRGLSTSALFVKGRRRHVDGTVGHYHLQITASGLDAVGTNSEAELFKTIPDIDTLDSLQQADDRHVVITIRGIGEMEPDNPLNRISLHEELDEWGVRRASVSIQPSAKDNALWDAMDQTANEVARVFGGEQGFEVLRRVRDGLGTTHHETGGLTMGSDAGTSVTNENGRFHHLANAYALSPALFPTIGSPNPMLTGIAVARRMADHLIPVPQAVAVEEGFTELFDGLSLNRWRMSTIANQPSNRSDPGHAVVRNGAIETVPGNDLGLLWYTEPMPPDYLLRLQWKRNQPWDNSGVFVRFPHPDTKGYDNTAFVGVDFGFEIQLNEFGDIEARRTGAIYNMPNQTLSQQPARLVGEWNDLEIQVQGRRYLVQLNGHTVCEFQNPDPNRGVPGTQAEPSYLGLQVYPGSRMAFRNVRYRSLRAVRAVAAGA